MISLHHNPTYYIIKQRNEVIYSQSKQKGGLTPTPQPSTSQVITDQKSWVRSNVEVIPMNNNYVMQRLHTYACKYYNNIYVSKGINTLLYVNYPTLMGNLQKSLGPHPKRWGLHTNKNKRR